MEAKLAAAEVEAVEACCARAEGSGYECVVWLACAAALTNERFPPGQCGPSLCLLLCHTCPAAAAFVNCVAAAPAPAPAPASPSIDPSLFVRCALPELSGQ